MQRISTDDDIEAALDALGIIDPRLLAIRERSGEVPLRRSEPGFASLVSIVVSQQVSRASADAIFGRLVRLANPLTPETLVSAEDRLFREAGLSGPKQRALVSVSRAVLDGLDLFGLAGMEAAEAIARMTAVAGIGSWTAEVYLLFAIGHPDIFPARDVALQTAVGHAIGIDPRPGEKALAKIAESWAPHRGVASRLFWAYYLTIKGREGASPSSQVAKPPV